LVNPLRRESSCNPENNTLEPDRLQHDNTAARAIAQQYSSANFISLREFQKCCLNFCLIFFYLRK
jgi:hypothetical protein